MSKKKDNNISFKLLAIEILDFSLASHKQIPILATFQFDINLEHRVNNDKKLVTVVYNISVLSEKKEQLFGHVKTSCIYQIHNFNDFFDIENKKLKLPDEITTTLNSISLSTTRGIMFSLFRGTLLQYAVLPLVDPKAFKIQSKK